MNDEQANAPGLSIVEQLKEETRRVTKAANIPADKKGVVVVAAEWKFGVPYRFRFGTAYRVGDSFELGADAVTKFTKASTEATVHVAWSF